MYPIIHLGPLQIGSGSVVQAVAAVVLFVGVKQRVRCRLGTFPSGELATGLAYVLLGALAGSWLACALPKAVAYIRGAPIGPDWWRGQYWLGALGGGSLAGHIVCRRRSYRLGKAFDLVAPIIPLAQAVGRPGCLLAGACYGLETTAWCGLVLPDINGIWARRYPTQIVSMIANLLIALTILVYERYNIRRRGRSNTGPSDGFLFLLYVQLHCLQRFYFEFWRADTPILFGSLTWTHFYCALGMGLATMLLAREFRRARSSPAGSQQGSQLV